MKTVPTATLPELWRVRVWDGREWTLWAEGDERLMRTEYADAAAFNPGRRFLLGRVPRDA